MADRVLQVINKQVRVSVAGGALLAALAGQAAAASAEPFAAAAAASEQAIQDMLTLTGEVQSGASVTFLPDGSGGVARSMQAVLREHAVSVVDFGATGLGAADDTAAVQAALNTGKNVFIPAGVNCRVDTTLTTGGAGQRILGPGRITHTPDATTCITLAHADCEISGVEIVSEGAHATGNEQPTYAVIVATANGCSALNNRLTKVPKVGIQILGAGRCLVWGNQIDGEITSFTGVGHFGVHIDPGAGEADGEVIVSNNRIRNAVSGVFWGNYDTADTQSGFQITGNTFENCWDHGVYINYVVGALVGGNTFANCTMPIAARGNNIIVNSNVMVGFGTARTAGIGISLRDARRCVVSGNTLYGNCDSAATSAIIDVVNLEETELSENVIADNVIVNTGSTGVFGVRVGTSLTETSYGNTVRGNKIKGPGFLSDGYISFRMKAGSIGENNEVSDNLVYVSSDSYGIYIGRQRLAKVRDNQLRFEYVPGSAYTGIGILMTTSDDCRIEGNEVAILGAGTNVSGRAIQIDTCARTRVTRNTTTLDSGSAATLLGLVDGGLNTDTISHDNSWNMVEVSAAQDLASIANGASVAFDFFVATAALGGNFWISDVWSSASLQGCTISAYISAAQNVKIVVTNNTGAAVDLPSQTYYIRMVSRL